MSYQAMTNNIIILAVMKSKFIWVTQFNEVESLDSIFQIKNLGAQN